MTPQQAENLLLAMPQMSAAELRQALDVVRTATVPPQNAYAGRPVEYARDVLVIDLWEPLADALRAIHEPPYRVAIESGHSVGKTCVLAIAVNYFFDSFNPCGIVTTGPKRESVQGILWKEIRVQRLRARLPNVFIGPAATMMRTSPDHYAVGTVANTGEGFQGRHDLRMLFAFDEAVGIPPVYFEVTSTMFKPEMGHAWVMTYNPTDTTSEAYRQVQSGLWKVIKLDAMAHPNIAAQLSGRHPPVPAAVSVSQIDTWVKDWCTPVGEGDEDFSENAAFPWPPVDSVYPHQGFDGRVGIWWRPGPEMQSRCFGCWPTSGTFGVWSDWLWRQCSSAEPVDDAVSDWPLALKTTQIPSVLSVNQNDSASAFGSRRGRRRIPVSDIPEIGCDVARYGSNDSAWHVRWGNASVHHESANGWRTTQVAERCKRLASAYAEKANAVRRRVQMAEITEKQIPIKVDVTGLGAGVVDILQCDGYHCIGVNASGNAQASMRYHDKRSELWFQPAAKAVDGGVYLGLLPKEVLHKLRLELLAPKWQVDGAGRRQVEKKEETAKRVGRSPDNADAFNLAYLDGWQYNEVATMLPNEPSRSLAPREGNAKARGVFGRGR